MDYSPSDHLIPLTIVPPCLQLYSRYVNIYRSALSFNLLEDNFLGDGCGNDSLLFTRVDILHIKDFCLALILIEIKSI